MNKWVTFVVIALLHAFKEAILLASVAEVGFHPVKHVVVVVIVVVVIVVVIVIIVFCCFYRCYWS